MTLRTHRFCLFALLLLLGTALAPAVHAYTATGNLPLQVEAPGSSWATVVADATSQSQTPGSPGSTTTIYSSFDVVNLVFEGDFTPDINTTSLALLSDDGCDVTINYIKILPHFNQTQHLPNLLESLSPLSMTLVAGHTYHIRIDYSNINGQPIGYVDGCTLFAYSGNGPTVTADTSGITAANFNSRVAVQASGPLTATVTNPPQSTADCTVNPPTWSWSYGNVQYSMDGKNFVDPPVSSTISISQPDPSSPKATFYGTFNQIGYWAVAVTATATYTSNRGSISVSGTDDIGSVNGGQISRAFTKTYRFQVANYVRPHHRLLRSTVLASRKAVATNLSLLYNGAPVTDTPIPVMVGQKISLTAEFSQGTLQGPYIPVWTVPGDTTTRVANYTQTVDSGKVVPLASPPYGNTISFYWIAGSFPGTSQQVTCTVGFYGTYTKQVNFLVFRPEARDPTTTPFTEGFRSDTTTHSPPVFIGDNGDSNMRLSYGTEDLAGILWKTILYTPANGAGTVAITQLINSQRIDTCATDGHTISALTKDTNGNQSYFLDDKFGLQLNLGPGRLGPIPVPGSYAGTAGPVGGDTPSLKLVKAISKASVNDQFHTYLVYKPAGADSIWVTLSRMDWSWSGSATRNVGSALDLSSTYGDWSLDKNADGSPKTTYPVSPPIGTTTTELPVWSNNFTSLHLDCSKM